MARVVELGREVVLMLGDQVEVRVDARLWQTGGARRSVSRRGRGFAGVVGVEASPVRVAMVEEGAVTGELWWADLRWNGVEDDDVGTRD